MIRLPTIMKTKLSILKDFPPVFHQQCEERERRAHTHIHSHTLLQTGEKFFPAHSGSVDTWIFWQGAVLIYFSLKFNKCVMFPKSMINRVKYSRLLCFDKIQQPSSAASSASELQLNDEDNTAETWTREPGLTLALGLQSPGCSPWAWVRTSECLCRMKCNSPKTSLIYCLHKTDLNLWLLTDRI